MLKEIELPGNGGCGQACLRRALEGANKALLFTCAELYASLLVPC